MLLLGPRSFLLELLLRKVLLAAGLYQGQESTAWHPTLGARCVIIVRLVLAAFFLFFGVLGVLRILISPGFAKLQPRYLGPIDQCAQG